MPRDMGFVDSLMTKHWAIRLVGLAADVEDVALGDRVRVLVSFSETRTDRHQVGRSVFEPSLLIHTGYSVSVGQSGRLDCRGQAEGAVEEPPRDVGPPELRELEAATVVGLEEQPRVGRRAAA